MKPFLIVYFSGAGNTRVTAEKIKKLIEIKKHAEIYSVEKLPDSFDINDYSAVILGTPTYHSEPAAPLMKFVNTSSIMYSSAHTYTLWYPPNYTTNTKGPPAEVSV